MAVSAPSYRNIRVLLVFGILAGISTYLVTPLEQPAQFRLASDVYYYAVTSFLDGGDLYGVYPPDRSGYAFLYPPATVVLFLPHILLGSAAAAYVLQTILNIAAALGTAIIIFRALVRRGATVGRIDLVLLGAFMLFSTYSAIQFLNGQVNLWLAFALAIGFDAIDRNRDRVAGGAFAFAALLKVFPAVLGLWLLRIRSWIGVAVALSTGIAGLLVGVLLFGPELTITYLEEVLLCRFEGETYDGRPDPGQNVDGIHRQLAAIWPGGPYHTIIGFVIIGTLLTAASLDVNTRINRDAAALATIIAILLFLPLQPLYFPLITFPLFMLLYAQTSRIVRWLLIIGTVLTLVHLDPASIDLWIEWVGLPAGIADPVTMSTAALFTFILPPTLGLWILLLACIVQQFQSLDLSKKVAVSSEPVSAK